MNNEEMFARLAMLILMMTAFQVVVFGLAFGVVASKIIRAVERAKKGSTNE